MVGMEIKISECLEKCITGNLAILNSGMLCLTSVQNSTNATDLADSS